MQVISDEAQRHARLLAEKKADEIQSFADRKDIKNSLMHSRQFMVPRAAQEPPHSLVQMELVF